MSGLVGKKPFHFPRFLHMQEAGSSSAFLRTVFQNKKCCCWIAKIMEPTCVSAILPNSKHFEKNNIARAATIPENMDTGLLLKLLYRPCYTTRRYSLQHSKVCTVYNFGLPMIFIWKFFEHATKLLLKEDYRYGSVQKCYGAWSENSTIHGLSDSKGHTM